MVDNYTDVFAYNLRHLREQARLKRSVLSELCGLHPGAIRRYERCEQEPTLSSLMAIAEYFGLTLNDLVAKNF